MGDFVQELNSKVGAFAWGPWTVALIAVTGLFLMAGLRFIPLRKLGYGFKLLFDPVDQRDEGEISPFQALMTSLAATIGTGNIAGVDGVAAVGGPGAIFWMWLIAAFGIATKYAEAVLAVPFRETDAEGNHVGGPMYYIRNGLGSGWSWMAGLFAVFGMLAGFGIGNGVQAFELAKALEATVHIPRSATGVVLGVLIFLVVIGGIRRIARAASAIVPVMAILYVAACLLILAMQAGQIPSAFGLIFTSAFSGQAAVGGAFGAVVLQGFKRGIFSNEAGLGSAPIAHAASKTSSAVRQGAVAMLGTFIDTFVVCTMTALVVITTYAETLSGLSDEVRGNWLARKFRSRRLRWV